MDKFIAYILFLNICKQGSIWVLSNLYVCYTRQLLKLMAFRSSAHIELQQSISSSCVNGSPSVEAITIYSRAGNPSSSPGIDAYMQWNLRGDYFIVEDFLFSKVQYLERIFPNHISFLHATNKMKMRFIINRILCCTFLVSTTKVLLVNPFLVTRILSYFNTNACMIQ